MKRPPRWEYFPYISLLRRRLSLFLRRFGEFPFFLGMFFFCFKEMNDDMSIYTLLFF